MNCQQTRELLSSLIEGTLHGEELYRIRRHLASCADCRSGLSPGDLMEILPVLDDSIEPSEDFKPRFYSELQRRQDAVRTSRSAASRPLRAPAWVKIAAAAAVLVVIIAAGAYMGQSPLRRPDTTAVYYDLEMTENLSFFMEMGLIENLELFEDLDAIENLPQLN